MTGPRSCPLVDAAARGRASKEFDRNLVAISGAGTGKTSLLVERILVLVGSGHARLDRVAAITFTEKAAGEMRFRLASELETLRSLARGESAPDPAARRAADRAFAALAGADPAVVAGRSLEALEDLDTARVTTIHAFCADLLRRYPVEAGISPDFAVDEGPAAEACFDEFWDRLAEAELGPRAGRAEAWRSALRAFPLASLRALVRELSRFTIDRVTLEEPRPSPGALDVLGPGAAAAAAALDGLLARQTGLSNAPRGWVEGASAALRTFCRGGLAAFRATLDGGDFDPDYDARPNAKLTGVSPGEFLETVKRCRRLLRGLGRIDGEAIEAAVRVAAPAALAYRETLLARGILPFDALLAKGRDLLRARQDVRDAIKSRYATLLVDEFQDTDPLQYEIVLFLGERPGGAAADPFTADLAPGRLFVVGDPKQSIYRFRRADYAAFRRAVDRIAPVEADRLVLSANFRSVPGILEPLNALFDGGPGSPWRASAYQPTYRPISAIRDGTREGPSVELWTLVETGGVASRRDLEARAIAAEISRMVSSGEADYREVLILLRSFSDLHLYLGALRRAAVPYVVDGGRQFLERPEVVWFLALLRAVARPSDRPALLAYLRSPAGAVPDTELDRWAAGGGRWHRAAEPDPGRFPALADALGSLRRLVEATRALPVDAAIGRLLRDSGLATVSGLGFDGPQRVANLFKLAETATELARSGSRALNEVIDAVAEARAPDVDADSPLADERTRAVRVLTIHKAKGLEAPVVFLPDLGRRRADRAPSVPVRAAETSDSDGVPRLAIELERSLDPFRLAVDLEDEEHDRAEFTRLLYVAATRAADRLILVGSVEAGKGAQSGSWLAEAFARWGYDAESPPEDGARLCDGAVLHRRIDAVEGLVRPEAVPAGDDEATDDAVRAWETVVGRLRSVCRPRTRPARPAERAEAGPRELSASVPPQGLAVGDLVHRALERWDRADPAGLVSLVSDAAAGAASRHGIDAEVLAREAEAVVKAFVRGGLAGRLAEVEVIGREVPVLVSDPDGTVRTGTIDLLYRDASGEVVVADYKTDREEDEVLLVERHREQISVYAGATERALALPRPPRAELWLLRHGRIVEVPPAPEAGGPS